MAGVAYSYSDSPGTAAGSESVENAFTGRCRTNWLQVPYVHRPDPDRTGLKEFWRLLHSHSATDLQTRLLRVELRYADRQSAVITAIR